MSFRNNLQRTIIVCKSKAQAKNLFERYSSSRSLPPQKQLDSGTNVSIVEDELKVVFPSETYWFVPERSLYDVLHYKRCVTYNLVSGYWFDKWMDKREAMK